MTQDTTDDLSQLGSVAVTVAHEIRSNNERVRLYATADGETPHIDRSVSADDVDRYGVIRHDYEGLPARGTVLYDVTDYEVVDVNIPDDGDRPDNHTDREVFEAFEYEYREIIERDLFSSEYRSASDAQFTDDTHTVLVRNPHDGDELTVKLHTTNKRRVRG